MRRTSISWAARDANARGAFSLPEQCRLDSMTSLILISFVAAMTAAAHLLLKEGMTDVGRVGADQIAQPLRLLTDVLAKPLIIVALILYGSSFVGWIVVLSRLQLSLAYPTLALMYVFIPLGSWTLLHESISGLQWTGIVVIFFGVLLVLRGGWSML